MRRGMGQIVHSVAALGASIAGAAWPQFANGGMASGPQSSFDSMPRFDRGGQVQSQKPQGQPAQQQPQWAQQFIQQKIETIRQRDPQGAALMERYFANAKSGPTMNAPEQAQLRQALQQRGIWQEMPHDFMDNVMKTADTAVNIAVPALTIGGITGGLGAAAGFGSGTSLGLGSSPVGPGMGANAGIGAGATAGGGAVGGTAGAGAGWAAADYGMSTLPTTPQIPFYADPASAGMSRAPAMSYLSNTGAAAAGGAADYADPKWQAQNSSQVPQYSQFDPAAATQPQMSTIPGSSPDPSWYTGTAMGGGYDPVMPGYGGYGGNEAFGGSSGSAPQSGYGDFGDTSGYDLAGPSETGPYAGQSFNMDASYTEPMAAQDPMAGFEGGDQIAQNPYQMQSKPMAPSTNPVEKIYQGIKGGVSDTLTDLPRSVGRALPGMLVSGGVQALAGGKGGGQDDPGYEYAKQNAATDAQRNQMALGAQREFTANASKYGSDDYYRQMGDMSAMQFRTSRIGQRQEQQRQLAAQGRDPTTIAAILGRFDNDTETGSMNARNSSYLSARNSGLGPQQAAAGMYGNSGGAEQLSRINTSGVNASNARNRDLAQLFSAPLRQQSQDRESTSGSRLNAAADDAAKKTSDKFGLGSSVLSRK